MNDYKRKFLSFSDFIKDYISFVKPKFHYNGEYEDYIQELIEDDGDLSCFTFHVDSSKTVDGCNYDFMFRTGSDDDTNTLYYHYIGYFH